MNKRAIMWGILLSLPLWTAIGWTCEQCNFMAEHAKGQRVTTPSAKATQVSVHGTPTPIGNVGDLVAGEPVSPTPNPACAIVPGFEPHRIVTMKGNGHVYQGETVYTKDGCPALLVLIPIDRKGFKVNGKATPTPASNGE